SLPSNNVPNPRADLKAITTRSGVTLAGPSVSSPPSKEVDQEPEMITDQCNLPGSDFTFILAVASFYIGSGNFFCQWELYNWQ
nr:reverse transcriptase domain-containing protein [Tanacetum cinerariifolium]